MGVPPEDPSDEALMARVQSGDDGAFGLLMMRWERPIKRFLARMLQNQEEAADIAQEVFVRLYRERDRYRTEARFAPWLWTIAANLARNRLRWWRRRPAVSLEAWTEVTGSLADSRQEDGAAHLQTVETAEAVRAAVASLPVEWRAAIVLCEFEGLAVAEAAAALGTTTKSVESRLYRARERLRIRLAHLRSDGRGA